MRHVQTKMNNLLAVLCAHALSLCEEQRLGGFSSLSSGFTSVYFHLELTCSVRWIKNEMERVFIKFEYFIKAHFFLSSSNAFHFRGERASLDSNKEVIYINFIFEQFFFEIFITLRWCLLHFILLSDISTSMQFPYSLNLNLII